MNKEQIYKVQTEDGRIRRVSFIETEHPKDYGNGKIITVVNHGTGECDLIDCRYIKGYQFATVCENWIKDYYGEKLLKFEKGE